MEDGRTGAKEIEDAMKPSEVQSKVQKALTKDSLPNHPLLALLQSGPIVVLRNNIYTASESPDPSDYLRWEEKRIGLGIASTLSELDTIYLSRCDKLVEDIARPFLEMELKNFLPEIELGSLDLSQLIARDVFPHLDPERKDGKAPQNALINNNIRKVAEELRERFVDRIQKGKQVQKRSQTERTLDTILAADPPEARPLLFFASDPVLLTEDKQYVLAPPLGKEQADVMLQGNKYRVGNASAVDTSYTISRVAQYLLKKACDLHCTTEKLSALISKENAPVLLMKGVREHKGNGFGFVTMQQCWVYINVPAFALKGQDGRFYQFSATRLASAVSRDGDELTFDKIVMMENNNHPFLHNNSESLALVCMGNTAMPEGKTVGETIALRLKEAKNRLMYGYAKGAAYAPCFKLQVCPSCKENHYRKNLTALNVLNQAGIQVLQQRGAE